MDSQKHIVIIGAGILGLMQAYLLSELSPQLKITLLDAAAEPGTGAHTGSTFGQGRDVRHFTGSEGLSLQNPVHARAVALHPCNNTGWAGWKTIESDLTQRELCWQSEVAERFVELGEHAWVDNPYNHFHTGLNFAGMECWDNLLAWRPEFSKFQMTGDNVHVLFEDEDALHTDFYTESYFEPRKGKVQYTETAALHENFGQYFATDTITDRCLKLSGSTWRIQSLGKFLIEQLKQKPNVTLHWNHPVRDANDLPDAGFYFWSAHGDILPDIYEDHSRVQGLGGFWVTLPNTGFRAPFKISAPQPSGYINLTPDGENFHISAGFGWTGNRSFAEAADMLHHTRQQTLEHLSHFLKLPLATLFQYEIGTCIRPSTPTGLPDIKTIDYKGKPHAMFSGSGKAGATQAVLLALYGAQLLSIDTQNFLQYANDETGKTVIQKGLNHLAALAQDQRIYNNPRYPQSLASELKLG